MIVWLASYPRSGNTFFRILLNQIYGIKTYSIYNDPLFDQLKGSSEIIGHHKLEMSNEALVDSEELFFVKTHHLPSDNYPAIYLLRDGRDSVVSYAHYLMSFQVAISKKTWRKEIKRLFGWDEYRATLERLIVSSGGHYGNWSENVKQWTNRSNAITIPIRFEDLIDNPVDPLVAAIDALGISNKLLMETHKIPSFQELHNQWPQFFRQGKTGGWKKEMALDLQDLFWQYHGKILQDFGYND